MRRRPFFPELLDRDHWTRLGVRYEYGECLLLGAWSLWPEWSDQLRWIALRGRNSCQPGSKLRKYLRLRIVAAELSCNCVTQSGARDVRALAHRFSALAAVSQPALQLAVFRLVTA